VSGKKKSPTRHFHEEGRVREREEGEGISPTPRKTATCNKEKRRPRSRPEGRQARLVINNSSTKRRNFTFGGKKRHRHCYLERWGRKKKGGKRHRNGTKKGGKSIPLFWKEVPNGGKQKPQNLPKEKRCDVQKKARCKKEISLQPETSFIKNERTAVCRTQFCGNEETGTGGEKRLGWGERKQGPNKKGHLHRERDRCS